MSHSAPRLDWGRLLQPRQGIVSPRMSRPRRRNLSPLVPVEFAQARACVSRFGWGALPTGVGAAAMPSAGAATQTLPQIQTHVQGIDGVLSNRYVRPIIGARHRSAGMSNLPASPIWGTVIRTPVTDIRMGGWGIVPLRTNVRHPPYSLSIRWETIAYVSNLSACQDICTYGRPTACPSHPPRLG